MKREEEIRDNILRLEERLTETAERAGRSRSEIRLIAVGKTRPLAELLLAAGAGVREFGENRVQELLAKEEEAAVGGHSLSWHMIGGLQRNKVRPLMGKVGLIHSVHSLKLLATIEEEAGRGDVKQEILLQINIAKEASKQGFLEEESEQAVEAALQAEHCRLRGLMCMAPYYDHAEDSFPVFERCRRLSQRLSDQYGSSFFQILSMGMSHDYIQAVRAGATDLRIGSLIFGKRQARV